MSNQSTDLVSDLRAIGKGGDGYELTHAEFQTVERAADEIERLKKMHGDWFNGPNGVKWYMAENDRLREAIDEHMRTVCNSPKAAGRGADEKLWALVAHDVGAERGT